MYDGRGSVTQLTNAVGNVRDKYRYTPFGEEMPGGQLSPNTKLLNNPYGYNGEYHDLESGFQYLRARYYNPETARFITRDSYLGDVNEPLTLNRYAYTENNPVMKIDPSGHINLEAGGGGSSSSTYSTSTTSSSYTKSASSRPLLEWGSDNKEAVRTLQTMLKTLQYDIGKSGVDGIFGDDTDAAVRAFQRNNGLQVDGKVGINTWTKLEEIYNNVIGTGIIPDNVSQGSNGSGGSGSNRVKDKATEANANSNNSNACDFLGGGFVSSEGMYEDKLKQALKKYSNIKDPAQRVYVAWNLTSPEERLQLLKIDSRAYAGEQFVSRLSYLQYRKGIDVTSLSLNELDKIYEEVHYTRVATTMDYLNISSVIAEGYEKVGKGISELLKKAKGADEASKTVWDNIKITQPMYDGTKIPKSFELTAGGEKFWVHPNGTKHMVEYITRDPMSHGMPINSQTLLSSFQNSVSGAVKQGVKYDEIMNVGDWELIFSRPRGEGLLPVIKHAVYRP